MLIHINHLGTNTFRCGKTQIRFYVVFSLSTLSIDLTPLNPETCWDLTQKNWLPVYQAIQTGSVTIEMASLKRAAVPFLDCGPLQIDNSAIFISFPESQGRLVKSC